MVQFHTRELFPQNTYLKICCKENKQNKIQLSATKQKLNDFIFSHKEKDRFNFDKIGWFDITDLCTIFKDY